jgi:hypothetical protein
MAGETPNQRLVREKLDEFSRTFKNGNVLRAYLEKNGVKLVEATRLEDRKWRLIGALPEHIGNLFDVQGDVLIFATSFDHLQPRILTEMQREISRNTRFDNDLCFLATTDARATSLVRQRRGELAFLTINPERLSNPSTPELRTLIAGLIATIDHFNVTTPITSPPAFFGRSREIRDITKELELGTHVGVFGLRKAGKSSLVAQVRAALEQQAWSTAWVDLGHYVGNAPLLVRDLIVQLASSARCAIQLAPTSSRGEVESMWLDDLAAICRNAGSEKRMLIVLDEFDLATPGAAFATDSQQFELIATLSKLRGALQQHQANGISAPVVLAAGINPNLIEVANIHSRPNPLFQFLKIHYIEPLEREELAKMVRALGKKTGLKFTDAKAIDELLIEYGGHPLLSRQACSFVHEHRPAAQVPHDVSWPEVERAFQALGSNTPLQHAVQAAEEFTQIFPEEGQHVFDVLLGKRPAVDLGFARHARVYGLTDETGTISFRALSRAVAAGEMR